MKKTHNKLTCLFGHHDYSKRLTRDKSGTSMYICKICKRSGYYKWSDNHELWHNYDEEGNLTHEIWGNGYKRWYKKGNLIHEKWSDGMEYWYGYTEDGDLVYKKYANGDEHWKANAGYWIKRKPKNWKYEKDLQ